MFLRVVALVAYSWADFFRAVTVELMVFVMEVVLPAWFGLVDLVQLVHAVVFVALGLW